MAGEAARRRRRPKATKTGPSRPDAGGALIVRPPSATAKQRLRYRFDALLSRGPLGVIALLLAVTLGFVLIAALVFTVSDLGYGGDSKGFAEDFWQSLLRVLDSGTFSADVQWPVRVVALLVTLVGIFIASAVIGIISTGFEQRLEALRRGRSLVIEDGHTLILGWSPRVFSVLSELVIANESRKGAAVVVLASRDKTEMEEAVADRVPDLKGTRLVCRTGDPSSPIDLERVAVGAARSVVVLSDEQDEGDGGAVKAALATHTMLGAGSGAEQVPIVVELSSERTAAALSDACGSRVLPVHADDIIAKVAAQACHQAGLGAVYRELLDFDGDEIYAAPCPELAGKTFADSLLAYAGCTVLGLEHADGTVTVLPDMDALIAAGDQVLVVAEDDSVVRFTGVRTLEPAPAPQRRRGSAARGTRLLLIGWSDLGSRIIAALDGVLPAGAEVHVIVDPAVVDPDDVEVETHTLSVQIWADDGIGEAAEGDYDQIFVLGYRGGLSRGDADARTLLTLVSLNRRLRDVDPAPRVVAEVLESRTVPIAATTGADDFVVSDELASLLMSQLAENPRLAAVFDALFGHGGPTIAMHPASAYAEDGTYSWPALVAAVQVRGDVALGYRAVAPVVVNPSPDTVVAVGADTQLAVLTRRPLA